MFPIWVGAKQGPFSPNPPPPLMPATQATKHMKKRLRKENEHKRKTPTETEHGFKNNSLVLKKHYPHDDSFEYNLHFFCNILNDLHVRTLQDTGCPVPKM